MDIGVPKEIKNNEFRVGLTPVAVRELTSRKHKVFVETSCGVGINADDQSYIDAGAVVLGSAAEVFAQSNMIVKVKEPQPQECKMLNDSHILYTYLHLAPDPEQTKLLIESGCTAIAYETITDDRSLLPLLAPMSEVAGRMSSQVGAIALQKNSKGRGILMSGVPGTEPAKVVIIGGGVVGSNAASIAVGMGADVTILDMSLPRLRELENIYGSRVKLIFSTSDKLEELVSQADMVVGAVLVAGSRAPRLISRAFLSEMKKGSVLVDVAIDQGGVFETSKATTHDNPTYVVDDIVHYCVANMPGAYPYTSSYALGNATLPFAIDIASKGWKTALKENKHLKAGLNVCQGSVTYGPVAEALGYDYVPADSFLS